MYGTVTKYKKVGKRDLTPFSFDIDGPLLHNKTAFPIILLGFDETNRLKDL
jgi:hypothetical protein